MTSRRGRGRPGYRPTARQRRRVAIAAGAGMSHQEIALALGISRTTLAKHFSHELSIGAAAKRLDAMDALFMSATMGNVAAQKAYLAQAPKIPPPPAEKLPALGKKGQANVDAKDAAAGTPWEKLLRH